VKIATWNVNGIRAREVQAVDWLAAEQPDVVCLQEIKASPEQVPEALARVAGYWSFWHGFKGYSGVALLLRKERFAAEPKFWHPGFDHENRIVAVSDGDAVFATVYVPNGGKDFPAKMTFLEEMARWVAVMRAEGRRVVLCGDWNVARTDADVHPKERKPVVGQLPEERALIEKILAEGGLVDLGRAVDPQNDRLFTWWAPWRSMRQRNIGWRLDYVAVPEALFTGGVVCKAFPEVGTSDHAPVIAVVDFARVTHE
jgi:exodeoxyribonuclease-3